MRLALANLGIAVSALYLLSSCGNPHNVALPLKEKIDPEVHDEEVARLNQEIESLQKQLEKTGEQMPQENVERTGPSVSSPN